MQTSGVRERVQVPALLAHAVTDTVDVERVGAECDDRELRVANDEQVVAELRRAERGNKCARSSNNLLGRLCVAAGGQLLLSTLVLTQYQCG